MKWFKKKPDVMWISPIDKPLKIGDSETVLGVALRNKVEIGHSCEGMGSCTTCRVFVEQGEVNPRTEVEADRARERGFQLNERLSCQLKPTPGLKVRLPN